MRSSLVAGLVFLRDNKGRIPLHSAVVGARMDDEEYHETISFLLELYPGVTGSRTRIVTNFSMNRGHASKEEFRVRYTSSRFVRHNSPQIKEIKEEKKNDTKTLRHGHAIGLFAGRIQELTKEITKVLS